MKQYNQYLEYTKENLSWMGEIPKTWEIHKLDRLASLVTGNTPPKAQEENYKNGYVPWVKPDNILENHRISETKEN